MLPASLSSNFRIDVQVARFNDLIYRNVLASSRIMIPSRPNFRASIIAIYGYGLHILWYDSNRMLHVSYNHGIVLFNLYPYWCNYDVGELKKLTELKQSQV